MEKILSFAVAALYFFWITRQPRCPKCGSWMKWNDGGYEKWDCTGCAYSSRNPSKE